MESDKMRVMIVDDDEDDFFLAKELFDEISDRNITVEWSSTFDKGIESIKANKSDLYLVDYLLGAKTGIDFLIEAQKAGCRNPIIMLTGKGDIKIDRKAMAYGAADYLEKSEMDASKLERAVRYAMERWQASKKISESEEKYRNIFESTRDVIYITDEDGKFIDANYSAVRVLGYTKDELLQINAKELYENPEDRNRFVSLLMENGEANDFEVVLLNKKKERKFCLLSASVQHDVNGKMIIQGIIHDITKRRKAEQNLATAEKLAVTGKVVRMIAHEVRNPLTNINLSLEQMQAEAKDQENLELYFDIIRRNSERINLLITELLNSSKPAELKYGHHSLNEVVETAICDVQDRMVLKGIKLEKEFADNMCDVHVDADKVRIALVNIFVNAVEAMSEHIGVLHVKTWTEEDKCVVEIKDNGSGIPAENLVRIFDPFFSGKPKGTGLGLSTTHNIIRSHNGTIDVESEPGKGTRFNVKFNIYKL
jgi:PAS domain S-box-containing protein